MLVRFLRSVTRLGVNAVLPPRCGGCGVVTDTAHAVCADCWAGLRFIADPLCVRCGYPFEIAAIDGGEGRYGDPRDPQTAKDVLCAVCAAQSPAYDRARAALVYDDASRDYLLRFKHADRIDLAPLLARWLMRAGGDLCGQADLIVPVPLHGTRLRFRRYNQSGLLAGKLAEITGIPVCNLLLKRVKKTRSLGGMGPAARKREVGGAFSVDPRQAARIGLEGKRVVLIDDVLTTGATVHGCARILKRAGAIHVSVITVARVVR